VLFLTHKIDLRHFKNREAEMLRSSRHNFNVEDGLLVIRDGLSYEVLNTT